MVPSVVSHRRRSVAISSLLGGLEFEHGKPTAEARLEISQGAVAGAEDDENHAAEKGNTGGRTGHPKMASNVWFLAGNV